MPPVELWLTGPIGPGTTWNNQPVWDREISQVRSVPKAGQPCGPAWVGMAAWSAVNEAANKGWNNITLGIKATAADERSNNPAAWKRFHVKVENGVRLYPKLFVKYNRRPHAPHGAWVEPWRDPCRWCGGKTYLGGDQVHLKTRITDPQGGQVGAIWDIYNPEHRRREQWLSSNSVFSTRLDLRGLHGKTVTWRVRGYDGYLNGPTAHGPSFVVDRVAPKAAPGVSSPLYPADNAWHGGKDIAGTFRFTSSGVGDIDHYLYGFQDPPSIKVNADSLGGDAVVTLKPPHDGPVDLYVQSVDRAGNRSPVTTHHFYVRAGNGPLAHWSLDGNPEDGAFLGNRDGTEHGGLTYTSGAVGAAVRLDGVDDHITAPNTVDTRASFSVSAWVRPDTLGNRNRTAVAQDGNVVSGFLLQAGSDGRWRFGMPSDDATDGGQPVFARSQTASRAEQWTHLTGVHDAARGEIRLYVNGKLAATEPYRGEVRATGDLVIGRAKWNGDLTEYWHGAIDEVRVYDRVLSQAEIRSLVSLDNVQAAHWSFDNAGDVVDNAVPDAQAVTLHNGAGFTAHGAMGEALRLDGVDDYANTETPIVRSDDAFTVGAWVKLGEKGEDRTVVLSQNGSGNATFALGYSGNLTDRWQWTMRTPGGTDSPRIVEVTSQAAPQLDTWTHLMGVYEASTGAMRLYVNGQLAGTGEFTAAWHATDGSFAIGRARQDGAWSGYWPGAVDEVRAYSRALSVGEVRGIVSQDGVTAGSWKLDGTAADDSGSGRNGTPHGNPTWIGGQTKFPNPGDQALELDGTDDYVSAPNTVDTSKSFAVAAWVKLERSGDWAHAVSQDGARTSGFQLQVTHRGHWAFAMFGADVNGGGADHDRVISSQPAQLGVWTHLVGMYDAQADRIHLYVNGVHAGSMAHESAWNATGGLQIGRGQWYGNPEGFWPGAVDDVKMYSRLLFREEIRLLAGRDLTLVHNLRLDEDGGTTAADSVGGRSGTLHNGAVFEPGRVGNAVALDGVDDYVSTSGIDLRTDESFTVSAWVYLSEKGTKQVTAVSADGANTSKFRLGHIPPDLNNPFGAWVFEMPESDTKTAPITKAALSTLKTEVNTWTLLTGVYDATTGKLWLYVNGDRVGDGILESAWNAEGGLRIGRGKQAGAPAGHWPGAVDDVRLYTGRLTSDRIKALYDSYGPA